MRGRQGKSEKHDPVAGYTFGHDENERRTIFINKFDQDRPALARTGYVSSRRRRQSLKYCAPLDVSSRDPRNRRAVYWQRGQLVDASAMGFQEPNNSPHARSGFEGDGDEIMVDAPLLCRYFLDIVVQYLLTLH